MLSLEMLDEVFKCLQKGGYHNVIMVKIMLKEKTFEIDEDEITLMLEKLIEDKRAVIQDSHELNAATINVDRYYKINFNGNIFLETTGGYKKEYESLCLRRRWEDDLMNHSEDNAQRLNRLTRWLVVGTISLAVVELIKLFLCR